MGINGEVSVLKENNEKEKTEKDKKKESGIVTRESVSAVCALFSALAFLILCTRSLIFGTIGIAVNSFLLGLFGYLAYPLLLCAVYVSATSFLGKRFIRNRKAAGAIAVAVICAMLILHTAVTYSWDLGGYLSRCFRAPEEGAHGIDSSTPAGWVGGLIVYPLARFTTRIGALVILSALFLLFAYFSVYFWAGKALPHRTKEKKPFGQAPERRSAQAPSGAVAQERYAAAPPESAGRRDGEYDSRYAGAYDGRRGMPAENAGVYGNAYDSGYGVRAQNASSVPGGRGYAQTAEYGEYDGSYAARPEVRQRPGVSLPDGTPRDSARYGQAPQGYQPSQGASGDSFRSPQPADAASAADRADRTAFSPFGTVNGSARAEERPAGNTGYGEYQKSREFLFGGTPAENYRKNLIFDTNANVNKRPPVDPNQPAFHEGGFSGSYSAAYADSVNGGEEPARPAKILTDNTEGKDLYTPYTLRDSDSEPGFGGSRKTPDFGRDEGSVSSDSPFRTQPVAPAEPAQPFFVRPENRADDRSVGRDDFGIPRADVSSAPPVSPVSPFTPAADSAGSPFSASPSVPDSGSREDGNFRVRDGEDRPGATDGADRSERSDRTESARPSFMDIFSTSNPNIYGLQEDDDRPSYREDRSERGENPGFRFDSGRSETDSGLMTDRGEDPTVGGEGRGDRFPDSSEAFGVSGRIDRDGDRTDRTDRRDIFDEPEDPYSLRSDFSGTDRDRTLRDPLADDAETEGRRGLGRPDRAFGRDESRLPEEEKPVEEERKAPRPKPVPAPKPRVHKPYQSAPLDYFDCRDVEPDSSAEEVENTKQTILETLEAFKVTDSTIASVTYGPTVTRYNVVIPRNISARKVVALDQEIAMNLYASRGVNIYPNFEDGAVSIEVPNKTRQFVQLGCMLTGDGFTKSKPTALVFAMGKDVGNRKVYGDICKMTHLLVAGASGSGKSVFLRSLIISLIVKYSPQELRLILIDPKKTEFVIYDQLPHLMINEIITDIGKVIQSLNWAIGEMNRRYELFEQMSRSGTYVVNIDEYNAALPAGEEKLAKIVIIVDELADLMLAAKKEVEDRIQNLTQKSRAAGIHLIIATQRPSADVITGVIKGNLPTRIAFSVASDVDSRVILDASGAQKLLGMGDLLYLMAGMNTPTRVQGASISSEDAQKVVNYIKANNEADFDEAVSDFINNTRSSGGDSEEDGDDSVEEVYIDALRYIIQSGSASISMIQRKCSVGYNKAGKIIEWMEDMGYISAFDGAKARKVLITKEEFEIKYGPL